MKPRAAGLEKRPPATDRQLDEASFGLLTPGREALIIFDRAEEIVGGLAEMSWSAPGRSGVPATGRDTRT